jgi:F-type H+-transporting ATPase subunit a
MEIKEVLKELLMEDKTLIHLPFGNGNFDFNKSVVLSWVFIFVVFILILFFTHDMKIHNISKRQAAVESFVLFLRGIAKGMLGEEAEEYTTYIVSVLVFLACSNMMGLFGVVPPTMDLNVTLGLALVSIVMVETAGYRKKGVKGKLKSFAEPMAIIAPMNVLELAIRPLSLCMRLFGNILGATVIMELLKHILPVGLPVPFSLYFDIFDGFIQAYVFVFLTSLYIKEAVE